MVVGIVGGVLMPWPWPNPPQAGSVIPAGMPWMLEEFWGKVAVGVQPWPFWGPTFEFAPPGSWKLGLLNSVIGALAGSLVVRAMKWLFETGLGREALGLGDADLMMMAGAFLGWQIAVLSVFAGAFAAIVFYLLGRLSRRSTTPAAPPAATPVTGPADARELAFGPGLAVGVVATWIAWPWLGPQVQFPFFDDTVMVILVIVMAVATLGAALLLRGRVAPEPAPVATK
jgi:leader peptidase (prepilin peptidase)/N-methyltransferase